MVPTKVVNVDLERDDATLGGLTQRMGHLSHIFANIKNMGIREVMLKAIEVDGNKPSLNR